MNKKRIPGTILAVLGSLGISMNVYANTYGIIKADTSVVNLSDVTVETLAQKTLGDIVNILGKQDGQYKIKLENDKIGFISKDKIEVNSVLATISVENANLRMDADPGAWIEQKVAKETLVSAHYRYENWYYVKTAKAEGFVYKSQIQGDDLSLLEYRRAEQDISRVSGVPVETLDWWGTARYIFPRGAVASVEDVYTGKIFNIKRTFGTNHADVEALTSGDTAIIKSIWGGFSWERRPIIVNINGRRIGASMAAMPHAGKDSAPGLATTNNLSGGYGRGQNLDMVKGNNMDGVMDVHFLNSKRHKDGKIKATVDTAHQNAIKIAAKAK